MPGRMARKDGESMLRRLPRGRNWLAITAVILVALSLAPPGGSLARRYVFAESAQFVLFATAVPALIVLGAPWRMIGLPRRPAPERPAGSGFLRGAVTLLVFVGVLTAWRLPVTVDGLATQPGLVLAELVTLAAAGSALWLQLVESPPLLPRLSRPLRAVFAALAMWSIWILAYILGFSQVAWFRAYLQPGVNPVIDQEIATGLMWAVSAICFVPVVYVAALTWLRDTSDPDDELRAMIRAQRQQRGPRWPRPPRGWNPPSA
jgi:cytochrome c oxidase assembly factor CtaG